MSDHSHSATPAPQGKGGIQADVLSGFLVSLIALPLCLAIAKASEFPFPIMGVWTAVFGGVICTFLSNSQMTIKGPAAGMIVIVAGAVLGFKEELVATGMDPGEAGMQAYQMALGVGVVSGIIQIVLGIARAGVLSELFPISAVHGLLASIGVIIMAKQAYLMFGIGSLAPGGEPIEAIIQFPQKVPNYVREVTLIGVPSLILLFGCRARVCGRRCVSHIILRLYTQI
jgi:MFS superfamily sulfate permease-like transporter